MVTTLPSIYPCFELLDGYKRGIMNLKWLKEDKYLCHIYADISYGIFIDSIICSDFHKTNCSPQLLVYS